MNPHLTPVWAKFDTCPDDKKDIEDWLLHAGVLPDERVLLPVLASIQKRVLLAAFTKGEPIFSKFDHAYVSADFIAKVLPEIAEDALKAKQEILIAFKKIRENLQDV